MMIVSLVTVSNAQIAKGGTKYLGNITTSGAVRSDFITYWNQITAENECKWGSVQPTSQSQWSWSGCDDVYKYAKNNGIPFKLHTLVWGGQLPGWFLKLGTSAQTTAVTNWMDSAAAHYPNADLIDVVNEATPGHNPFRDSSLALGDKGSSGYDWVIKAFTMARARWPKAKLILNDYNNIRWNQSEYITLAKAVVNSTNGKNIIDAIGCQAHDLGGSGSYMDSASVASSLKTLSTQVGLPIYVSEFDLADATDASQLTGYKATFPPIWQSPYVAGVTLWGYIVDKTWITGSVLLTTSGTARPAFTWLQSYVKSNLNPPVPTVGPTTGIEEHAASVVQTPKPGMTIKNVNGRLLVGIEKDGRFVQLNAIGRE